MARINPKRKHEQGQGAVLKGSAERNSRLPGGVLFAACVVLACSGRTSSPATADPSAGSTDSSEEVSGSGHLHLTGDVALDHDFIVEQCAIAPPGAGLLSGYNMHAKDGDSTIVSLAVVLKDYDKDGPYSPADKSTEGQLGQAMSTGTMGPLTLMVTQRDNPMPLAVTLKPTSTLVINISGNGAMGDAKFSDMETPLSFADFDPRAKGEPHGKNVSGSLSWKCGKVDHLNTQMNNAINGMFNKLMPKR